jgi:hypothetical protein
MSCSYYAELKTDLEKRISNIEIAIQTAKEKMPTEQLEEISVGLINMSKAAYEDCLEMLDDYENQKNQCKCSIGEE